MPPPEPEVLLSTWWNISSVDEQLEVNASCLVVLVVFDVPHPQLAPDLLIAHK